MPEIRRDPRRPLPHRPGYTATPKWMLMAQTTRRFAILPLQLAATDEASSLVVASRYRIAGAVALMWQSGGPLGLGPARPVRLLG